MARHLISGTFRAISDRIPFGRPVPPTEWLAPDPRDAQMSADAPFPGSRVTDPGDSAAAPSAASSKRSGPEVAAAVAGFSESAPDAVPSTAGSTPPEPAPDRSAADGSTDEEAAAAKHPPAKRAPAKRAPAKGAAAKGGAAEPVPAKRAPAESVPAEQAARASAATAVEPAAGTESHVAAVAPERPLDPQPTSPASSTADALPVRPGEEPWTAEEVAEVTTELRDEREQLLEEISYADAQLAEMLRDAGDNAVDDQADAGTRTFEREQEISLAAGTAEKLAQVDRALRRLADGSYGLCESCGQAIGKLRLQAFPRATLCLACKTQQERR